MAWDLALDNNFDLVFSANRDLSGVDGVSLMQQRIRTRLKIERGTWVYDRSGRLGSRLTALLRTSRPEGLAGVRAMISEALEDMDDAQIINIIVNEDELAPRGIAATVEFQPIQRRISAARPLLEESPAFHVTTTF